MENKDKRFIIPRSFIALGLALALLASLFFSVIKIGAAEVQMADSYYEGEITEQTVAIRDIDIGFGTFINIIKNFDDIKIVLKHQFTKNYLKDLESKMLAMYSYKGNGRPAEENEMMESQIDAIDLDIRRITEEYNEYINNIEEEKLVNLNEKLSDRDFVEALTLSYLLADNYVRGFHDNRDNSMNKLASDRAYSAVMFIMFIILIALVPIWMAIFAVILIINGIILASGLIGKKAKEKDKPIRFPFLICAISFILPVLFLMTVGSVVIKPSVAFFAVVGICIALMVTESIFKIAGKAANNKADMVVNVFVAVVCVALLALLCLNFSKLDMPGDLATSSSELSTKYVNNYYEQIQSSSLSDYEMVDLMDSSVSKMNTKNTVIVMAVTGATTLIMCVAAVFLLKQLSLEGDEKKKKFSRISVIVCALLLCVSFIPSVMGTTDIAARNTAYEKGNYKMLWGAALTSGTPQYTEYMTYTASHQACDALIQQINNKLPTAEGEELELFERGLVEVTDRFESVKEKMLALSVDKKKVSSVCILSSAALLISQFIFAFVLSDNRKKPVAAVDEADGVSVLDNTLTDGDTDTDDDIDGTATDAEKDGIKESSESSETESDENAVEE